MDDIQKQLEIIFDKVLEDVSNQMYNALMDIIQSDIYDVPESPKYKRTGDFKNAFKQSSQNLIKEIVYDWMSMSEPAPGINGGYSHGNYKINEDRRADLIEILNSSELNDAYSDFGGALGVRGSSEGYLTKFNNILDKDLNKWLQNSCKKYGLIVTVR